MQIDDFDQATALKDKMETSLPLMVRATKHLVKGMREKGEKIHLDQSFEVISVYYSGDMGGIMCALQDNPETKKAIVASLTHLKVDPEHPLADEIQAYQRRRIHRLALNDKGAFVGELLAERSMGSQKKRSKKGFGG